MKNILSILLVIGLLLSCNSTEEDYQYVGWNDYDLNEGVLVNTKWKITMYCGTEYMITFQENDFTYKIIKDWNIIYEEYDSERVGSTYGPKKMKWSTNNNQIFISINDGGLILEGEVTGPPINILDDDYRSRNDVPKQYTRLMVGKLRDGRGLTGSWVGEKIE
jgi:hypothetical protein